MSEFYMSHYCTESEYEVEARKRKIASWQAEQERLQRLIDFYQKVVDVAEGKCEWN